MKLMTNPYHYATFQAVLESAASIREATHEKASLNIEKAQAKQQRDYNNRHSTLSSTLPIGSRCFYRIKNDRIEKFTYKSIGPSNQSIKLGFV